MQGNEAAETGRSWLATLRRLACPWEQWERKQRILSRREARSDWCFRWFLRLQCGVCIRGDHMDAWHLAATRGRYWWLG